MTESKIYADNFKCSFGNSDQFLDFLKERKEKSLWMKAPSNSLQFKPLEKDSELGSLYMQLYQTNGSAEILVDTMENTSLLLSVNGADYPVRSCALKTILERARISGNALGKVSKSVLTQILNYCLDVATGDSLIKVADDKVSAVHPLFPFMLADVDRFIHLPNGDIGILECKTAHYDTQYLWANGAVPRHYELQVKHYMAVMNIDVAYIACLFSNSESDFVWRKIERDLDEEENNILLLQNFWNRYVLNRVEPPLTEKPDMVLAALSRYYGPADKNAPTVTVGAEFAPALEQLLAMKTQKKDLDAQSRKLDEQIKRIYAPIAELMGAACGAVCESNGIKYNISFAPQYREGISKDNLSKLRAQYPDAYDDLVQTTESRIFKLTKAIA